VLAVRQLTAGDPARQDRHRRERATFRGARKRAKESRCNNGNQRKFLLFHDFSVM
jgi:hypothetical protein